MEHLIVVVVGVVLIAVVTALGQRMNIASPLVLVAIGLLLAVVPFVPNLGTIDPDWILVGVLPPLLYSSAINLPAIEFRRDFTPIAGLSVLLVVLSAVILGFFFTWAIPGLSLPLGIALGAILSPTDAVATSIVKRMGISPRVVTLLEGESLLNDATALVLLRTATAAIAASFSFGVAVGAFVWGVVIAVIIGAVVGWVNLRVRAWVANSAANTALSFALPFIAYLPTEELGGSGLVAAVVAGIVTGQGSARWLTAEQRMSDRLNWRTIELILEGGVFLVMGLELSDVVTKNFAEHDGLWHGTWLALASLGIIVVVRGAYVTFLLWRQGARARRYARIDLDRIGSRLDAMERGEDPPAEERAGRRAPALPDDPVRRERRLTGIRRRVTRMGADLDYYRDSPLGWKHGAVIVWAGMRGVVTLAAAQTLPTDTDHRALLVFVAFMLATVSLLVQGFTLVPLVRLLGIRGTEAGETEDGDQADQLQDELREAASAALRDPALRHRDGTPFDAEIVRRAGERFVEPPDEAATATAQEFLRLRLALIEAQRRRLVEVTASGRYRTSLLRRTLAELDADQISLELKIAGGAAE
ncbi:MAG: sodium:proton antiporter [Microbacterium sp.]|uniref:cation:proton antiporter n=1 Tax=Microbacterium sp. TaxID=51671 RepID=UPI0039E3CD14